MSLSLCTLTAGRDLPCYVAGGNYKIFIGQWNDTQMVFTVSPTQSLIETIESGTVSFYQFQAETENINFAGTPNPSMENGTIYYELVVEITLTALDAPLAQLVKTLNKGAWRIVVLDGNGLYWMVGYDRPVRANTGGSIGTGQKYNDLNGAKLAFVCKSLQPALQIAASAITPLIVTTSI